MRRTALALIAVTLLAACGKQQSGAASGNLSSAFDDGFRKSYRTRFIETCTTGAKTAATRSDSAAAANLDFNPLCSCAADRLLATKSVGDLMKGPSEAEQAAVTQQCLKEHPFHA